MPSLPRVACFAAGVAVTYALLVTAVPRQVVGALYRSAGNAFFGRLGADRVARFEPWSGGGDLHDTRIRLGVRRDQGEVFGSGLPVNSVHEAFALVAAAAALSLWTPLRARERWRSGALVVGGSLAFAGLRLAVTLADGMSRLKVNAQPLLDLSVPARWTVQRASQVLGTGIEIDLVVPLLLWILVVPRRFDLEALFPALAFARPRPFPVVEPGTRSAERRGTRRRRQT